MDAFLNAISSSIAPLMWSVFLIFLTKSTMSIFKAGVIFRGNLVEKTEFKQEISLMKTELMTIMIENTNNIIEQKTSGLDKVSELVVRAEKAEKEKEELLSRLNVTEKALKDAQETINKYLRSINVSDEITRREVD